MPLETKKGKTKEETKTIVFFLTGKFFAIWEVNLSLFNENRDHHFSCSVWVRKINQTKTGKNTLKQGQVYKSYLKEETFFKNEKLLSNNFTQYAIVKNPKSGDKKSNSQPK